VLATESGRSLHSRALSVNGAVLLVGPPLLTFFSSDKFRSYCCATIAHANSGDSVSLDQQLENGRCAAGRDILFLEGLLVR
jgi:hypothetical protein